MYRGVIVALILSFSESLGNPFEMLFCVKSDKLKLITLLMCLAIHVSIPELFACFFLFLVLNKTFLNLPSL